MVSPKPSRKTKRENNAEIEGTLVLIKDPEHPNSDARLPALRLVAGGVVEFAKGLADAELRAFMERRIGTSLPEPMGDAAQAAAAVAAAAPASAAGAAATRAAQAEAAMAAEAETEDGTSSSPEEASITEAQGNNARDPVDTAAAMDVEDQPGSGSDTPGAAAAAAAAAATEEEALELKQEATEEVMGPAQAELSERVEHVAAEAQAEVKTEEEELVVQGEAAADEDDDDDDDEDEGEEESDRELPAVTPKPYVSFLLVFTASSPTANFRIATIDQEGEGEGGGGGDGDGGGGGGEDEGKSGGGGGEVEKIAIEPFVWNTRLVQLLMSVRDRCVRSTLRCACTSTYTCLPAGGDICEFHRGRSHLNVCVLCAAVCVQ